MQLISRSPRQPQVRIIVILALIVLPPILLSHLHRPPPPLLFLPMIIFGIIFWVLQRMFRKMADKVWDQGDALLIQIGPQHLHIPLQDIINLNYTVWVNPPMARILLRAESALGRSITFLPRTRPFSVLLTQYKHAELDALIQRIDDARLRHLKNTSSS